MTKLLPCPFCNGKVTMQAPNMHGKTCATCLECYANSGWGTPEEVEAKWNRRVPPECEAGCPLNIG